LNFSTPEKICSIIKDLRDADTLRAPVRALMEGLFNGDPPYTDEEEKENNIQVNVSWKEGTTLLLQARQQYENAFLSTGNYFTVTLPDAPPSKMVKWSGILTSEVNKVLKGSRPFFHTMREKFGSVCLHGIGAQMWEDKYAPIPFYVPPEDLLIPTDTLITLENLTHFAVRRRMTPGKLYRKTFGKGKNVDPGWNMDAVKRILASFKDLNQNQNNWNWYDHPEEMQELWKQNQTWYDSDATPLIKFWDFYFQGDEDRPCWYRVIVADDDSMAGVPDLATDPLQFIYQKDEPEAEMIDGLMHAQIGDGNNKPPFMWHSVRSLGFLLFDVVNMMNRLRCQFTQKVFEDMMLLFRVADPADRSRLDKVYMGLNYGIIPEGLSFVKRDERYDPDKEMIEMLMGNYKQLMGESTTAYTQDIDQGTKKERTAFEVQALLSQTAKLTGSMLNIAYLQEQFAYQEICRRLTCKSSPDFIAKKLRNRITVEHGIPEQWFNSDRWTIEPERVLGQGNMQLEQAQAKGLLDIRPMLNPQGQARVLNEYVFALTHDPKRTELIAPVDASPEPSNTVHDTELVFSAFMNGTPVTPRSGVNAVEVVTTMLTLMEGVVKGVTAGGGVGTPQQAHGLSGAAIYVSFYLRTLSEDPAQKQFIKQASDQLGQIQNEIKAMHQRQDEQAKAAQGNGADPEAAANLQIKQQEAQVKLQARQATDQQKLQHKQQDFEATQKRKNIEALGDVSRDTMTATVKASGDARAAERKAKQQDKPPSAID
jgi:hypothetical protein